MLSSALMGMSSSRPKRAFASRASLISGLRSLKGVILNKKVLTRVLVPESEHISRSLLSGVEGAEHFSKSVLFGVEGSDEELISRSVLIGVVNSIWKSPKGVFILINLPGVAVLEFGLISMLSGVVVPD